jgi:hypothetical protein
MPQQSMDDTLRNMLAEYRVAFATQTSDRRRQRRQLVETTMDALRKFLPRSTSPEASLTVPPAQDSTSPLPRVHSPPDSASTPLPMPDVLAGSIVNIPLLFPQSTQPSKEEIMQRLAQVYQGCGPFSGATDTVNGPRSSPPAQTRTTGKEELMETLRKLYSS